LAVETVEKTKEEEGCAIEREMGMTMWSLINGGEKMLEIVMARKLKQEDQVVSKLTVETVAKKRKKEGRYVVKKIMTQWSLMMDEEDGGG
jgi:hypothetical protein